MKRPRPASSSSGSSRTKTDNGIVKPEPVQTQDILEYQRQQGPKRRERAVAVLSNLVLAFRASRPGVCKWLSREDHILPEIVNIVYTVDFHSKAFKVPLVSSVFPGLTK